MLSWFYKYTEFLTQNVSWSTWEVPAPPSPLSQQFFLFLIPGPRAISPIAKPQWEKRLLGLSLHLTYTGLLYNFNTTGGLSLHSQLANASAMTYLLSSQQRNQV